MKDIETLKDIVEWALKYEAATKGATADVHKLAMVGEEDNQTGCSLEIRKLGEVKKDQVQEKRRRLKSIVMYVVKITSFANCKY